MPVERSNFMTTVINKTKMKRRVDRVRAKVKGVEMRPRLTVRRTNTRMIAQVINDEKAITLVYASDLDLTASDLKQTKSKRARLVGEIIGKKALEKGIKQLVFDRHGYLYHGRVKHLAEGARSTGLNF